MSNTKLNLGQIVINETVKELVTTEELCSLVARHVLGDWGEIREEDKESNQRNLAYEGEVQSEYRISSGKRIVIRTVILQNQTTIFFAEED